MVHPTRNIIYNNPSCMHLETAQLMKTHNIENLNFQAIIYGSE